MKVQVKSNFNDFIKKIKAIPQILDESLEQSVLNLLEEMKTEMLDQINSTRGDWLEPNGGLSAVDSASRLGREEDITYEVVRKGNGTLTGTIFVGRDAPRLLVGSGSRRNNVNPYLFIEFGWGIKGEEQPANYAIQNGWVYNINEHTKAWVYTGTDGAKHKTAGKNGINFFYNTIRKYRKRWRELVAQDTRLYFQKKGYKAK